MFIKLCDTAQKIKFPINDFFSKCGQTTASKGGIGHIF